MIKKADEVDIDGIIELHLSTFGKNHFSTVFSRKMLKRYFSLLLLLNKFNFVFYNENNDTLLGYVIAGYNSQEAVNEFMKKNFWNLIFALMMHPKFLLEKVAELFNRIKINQREKKVKCRLYLIAVNNDYKGKGIGKELVNYLENELKKDSIFRYGLSVRKDNEDAITFYNKRGYTIEYSDAKSIYYFKNI